MDGPEPSVPREVLAHYAAGLEARRLQGPRGQLESWRTRELLGRHLPPPPARVIDVGGGPGAYAAWLAARGYAVELVDPVPRHVEEAAELLAREGHGRAQASLGDARRLEHADATFAAALLLGPLYHLTERGERVRALAEARRVVRAGGVVAAAAVSRYASTLDGLRRGILGDALFRTMSERDLAEGQHRNATDDPSWFTTAFFHHPDELPVEAAEAGLEVVALYGIEGPAWILGDLEERWNDPARRAEILLAAQRLESEPALLGASAHLLLIARKP